MKNGPMEIIETHISWILLGNEVYKIKKPVKFSFLDFTTLEKRKFFCEEEVRLNQRMTPDVYLGVSTITKNNDGMGFDGSGKIIEYAVKMKRLDQTKKMDRMLINGEVSPDKVTEIAGIIANFHEKAEVVQEQYGSPKLIGNQIADLNNFREAVEDGCGLGREMDFVLGKSAEFIEKNKETIEKRKKEGKVKDCHGDLHSGNIFFDQGIKIVDCIEFSKDFRCIDVASDIAFLAMDLDAFGKQELSNLFVRTYIEKTGDNGAEKLLNLFKCYRANVRAKIAAIEWMQNKSADSEQRMAKYIKLAEKYATEL
ncbi:Uncharacterised protein [Candidatus Bilamarchaeum dharawalense]|uniref:Aminoglycoside phosphotransferase domain-containing protein n=1 Tax=Candidatus Bilamarchaeum dharawalense TaxID=2885759 RepID=A0A5E4LP87_9ARCH|nr:Uncharacterised protein [Candidatus Bilamarchaeum dharawalense]